MTPSKFRGGEGVERLRGRSTLSSPLSSLLWGGEGRREGWGGGEGGSCRGLGLCF